MYHKLSGKARLKPLICFHCKLDHHVKAIGANVHDTEAVDDVIDGDEDEIYGDSGYLNVEEHIFEEKKKEGREYKINRRRGAKKKLEPNDQLIFEIEEFAKSTVRSKVEHVFGVVKRLFRFRRTRYRGLRKQQARFNRKYLTLTTAPLCIIVKSGLLISDSNSLIVILTFKELPSFR